MPGRRIRGRPVATGRVRRLRLLRHQASHGRQQKRGTIVVDASDPANPRFSTNLTSPAMLDAWESLKVHAGSRAARRGLGRRSSPSTGPGLLRRLRRGRRLCPPRGCWPACRSTAWATKGNWAPDGRTYYATGITPGLVTAIDVSDPAAPRPHHDLLRVDGRSTAWVSARTAGACTWRTSTRTTVLRSSSRQPSEASPASNGLGIYDVSEIAERKPNPQVKLRGRGRLGPTAPSASTPSRSPAEGRPTWSSLTRAVTAARASSISATSATRGSSPSSSSRSRCRRTGSWPIAETAYNNENGGLYPFGYNSHYCNADRLVDPTILACANFESGLRVFDIRDVRAPREIAYFNPGGDGSRAPGVVGRDHQRLHERRAPDPSSNGARSGSPTRIAASTSFASPTEPGPSALPPVSDSPGSFRGECDTSQCRL